MLGLTLQKQRRSCEWSVRERQTDRLVFDGRTSVGQTDECWTDGRVLDRRTSVGQTDECLTDRRVFDRRTSV